MIIVRLVTLWQEKKKWVIAMGTALLFAASLLYYFSGNGQQEMIPLDATGIKEPHNTVKPAHASPGDPIKLQQTAASPGIHSRDGGTAKAVQGAKKIVVDIKGAVVHPGVYTVEANARLFQLIGLAGGLLTQADAKQVNEAAPLQDGSLVYIPIKGEAYIGPSSASQQGSGTGRSGNGSSEAAGALQGAGAEAPINLNRASLDELQKIPGIGPSRAASILQYRQEHNGFKTVDDLRQISGIGPKTLEKLRPKVCVQ
ncbi:helix-hairpin-helix domain-containing protein [Aneurinibacillus sp. Ricciae_BoGa-3]|uniref:helix-hairpin-helix domain-containing protein n=1 Tax=Aneurinibacillus sp. Ricciae_BoGa-3 TaxID=3022697 RepID=UPI0023423D74|nr:helix-hairpin-helix domain-containing protein [Aneurinibacillus sp. Ricciae_BoGa-3]WCK53510.1 helix-hairpin-helix domain-containing protein [Aneurinibacillus sp. Ricciae_BoGa-3]